MEEKINGEQLEQSCENVQSGIVENMDEGTLICDQISSSLGKFKDAESLLEAYNNLQAEFTRKCQKLSEATKQLEENSQALQSQSEKEVIPVFQNENWQTSVEEFLQNNSEAQKYSGDIANEILNDKELQTSPNALELAWARVMKKNFKEPDTLAYDQNFLNEKILGREEIKKQVLEEYFKNLTNVKTPPVISKNGNVAVYKQPAPTNMQEAKIAVEKLFNIKG